MSDYASIIGGNGTHLPVDAVPDKDPAAYILSGWTDWTLDLGNGGDALLGADAGGTLTVRGGNGDDTLLAGRGDDALNGENDDDWIDAGDGRDAVSGGNEDDTLFGGAGDDTAGGDNGEDLLDGGAGRDQLAGGNGEDGLSGGEGDDLLFGGNGSDLLRGGAGDDTLWGGEGCDRFVFDGNFGHDVIADLAAGDQILLRADLNGSGIACAEDLLRLDMVSGDRHHTLIQIGGDSIRLEGMDVAVFKSLIDSFVKIG